MSVLQMKIALLVIDILIVHGKTYQEDFYLQDKNNVNRLYSDINRPSSGNAESRLNFETLKPKFKDEHSFDHGFGRGAANWFPRHVSDNNNIDQGTNSHPRRWNPERRGKSRICQSVRGIPSPESGCCGVQLKHFPHEQQWNIESWPVYAHRFRRSAVSDIRPSIIINEGKPAMLHHLPWMVRLSINSYVPEFGSPKRYGGTIISSRYILTAAHCVNNTYKDLKQLEVILAEYDSKNFPLDCVRNRCVRNHKMKVDHVIKHPKYNDTYLQNDVALLRMTSDIPYTGFIRPICLPTKDIKNLSTEPIIIAGWGFNGEVESNLKRSALVNYVPDDRCKEKYSYKDEGMFCSIGGNGEDVCHGDSGGPLMVNQGGKYFLAGVVSGKRLGIECGSTSVPSLFNNIYYHLDWITTHVQ